MNKELDAITESACGHIDAISDAFDKIKEINKREYCDLCPTEIHDGLDGSHNGLCFKHCNEIYDPHDHDFEDEDDAA